MKIAELQQTKQGRKLTMRATTICEVVYNQNVEPTSIDMILLDEQGNRIQATIRKSLINQFKGELTEGKLYTLTHYEVTRHARKNSVVQSELMINFTPFTSLVEEQDNHAIPLHKFALHNLDRLEERTNKKDYLIDIIGWLIGVGEKQTVQVGGQPTEIRRLHVQDTSLNKVEVTLWRRESNLITTNIVTNQQGANTVVITALTVKNYNGKYQLNSTNATRIHLNLDIPEATIYCQRANTPTPTVRLEAPKQEPIEEQMFKNKATLHEICENQSQTQVTFTCKATITTVHVEDDWRYLSCDSCKKKVDRDSYCKSCQRQVKYPKTRYLLKVDIADPTATCQMTLFDTEAEKIVGTPVTTLVDLYNKDKKENKWCLNDYYNVSGSVSFLR